MVQTPKVDQKYIDLFMEYTHAPLPRRVFLDRLTLLAGGTVAASALLPLLENNYAKAAMVEPNDPRITVTNETFNGGDGVTVKTLVAKPRTATGRLPTVIVIHENRGLNPHIQDVTRRMGVEGFLAVGVDLMSMAGGTPADDAAAAQLFREVTMPKAVVELQSGAKALAARPDSNGKIGVVGFCWGGGTVNALISDPGTGTAITAAVAYYGGPAGAPANVPNIKAQVMLHNGALDTGTNAPYPAYIAAMQAANVKHQAFMYDGANHAFNNDTNAARYHEASAKLAWDRTVAFFKESLKT